MPMSCRHECEESETPRRQINRSTNPDDPKIDRIERISKISIFEIPWWIKRPWRCKNLGNLDIDYFAPQTSEGVEPAVFGPDVKDTTIRNSPALRKP